MHKVKKSKIHGRGLFSTEKIKKNQIIGKYKVVKIKRPNAYTIWDGKKMFEVVCNLKYINHSEKPNVVFYDDLTVVALRDIKPGEELTHKYE